MKMMHPLMKLFVCFSFYFVSTTIQAGTPIWTFTPLTATTVAVSAYSTVDISYTITNQSRKPHTLSMRPIPGVSQITTGAGICGSTFTLATQGSSCILSLRADGSVLTGDISSGPVVCQQGAINQCYAPSQANSLHITLSAMSDT